MDPYIVSKERDPYTVWTLFISWLFHGGAEEEEDELGEVEADDGAQGGQLVLG